jgi:hypothetical protein
MTFLIQKFWFAVGMLGVEVDFDRLSRKDFIRLLGHRNRRVRK